MSEMNSYVAQDDNLWIISMGYETSSRRPELFSTPTTTASVTIFDDQEMERGFEFGKALG